MNVILLCGPTVPVPLARYPVSLELQRAIDDGGLWVEATAGERHDRFFFGIFVDDIAGPTCHLAGYVWTLPQVHDAVETFLRGEHYVPLGRRPHADGFPSHTDAGAIDVTPPALERK